MRESPAIGVMGGTGLYALEQLTDIERVRVETPYGDPSDALVTGRLHGRRLVFLARHGAGHRLLPHEINFRANIWAMKHLGVAEVLSFSAVGSLRESIAPGHIVLVDQFLDRTRSRPSTFFGDGLVAHVAFADPVCAKLRSALEAVIAAEAIKFHGRGTYVCIEGPQFSTRAESEWFRSIGADVVGMTNLPEARLAREAELRYATVALATDYDCWHSTEASVSVEAVLAVLADNAEKARRIVDRYAADAPLEYPSDDVSTAARSGFVTPLDQIPTEVRVRLAPILDPIFKEAQT